MEHQPAESLMDVMKRRMSQTTTARDLHVLMQEVFMYRAAGLLLGPKGLQLLRSGTYRLVAMAQIQTRDLRQAIRAAEDGEV